MEGAEQWVTRQRVGGHATVGRLSNNVFWTIEAIRWKFLKKSRWTVTRQWSAVTRPSTDYQKKFFGRFERFEFYFKVTQRSLDSRRRSCDRRPTVKQRFLDVSSNLEFFWKKLLNGHATVVGGHATVGRLSDNDFWTFQAIWNFFEKSHWTVTRQWSAVRRPSADCLTTFFGRFKQFGIFLRKVTERSRDSGRRSRDHRPTVRKRFLDVSSNLEIFRKKSLNGHATVVGGHATVGRLSNNVFFYVSSNLKFFWRKSLNGHATVVGGHATVGRLSNNVFWTFQAIWIFFEKSHWTVTRQWSKVIRPSADCQTTFFGRFKQFEIFFEKIHWTVTRQWSEVTRPSADC